jgi:hypothetical protein
MPVFNTQNVNTINKIKSSDLARLNLEKFIKDYSNCTSWNTTFQPIVYNNTLDSFCKNAASNFTFSGNLRGWRNSTFNFYLDNTKLLSCAWAGNNTPRSTRSIEYSCSFDGNLSVRKFNKY